MWHRSEMQLWRGKFMLNYFIPQLDPFHFPPNHWVRQTGEIFCQKELPVKELLGMERIKELEDPSQAAASQRSMEQTGHRYYKENCQKGWRIRGVWGFSAVLGVNEFPTKTGKISLIPLYWFLLIKHKQVMAQSGPTEIGLESEWECGIPAVKLKLSLWNTDSSKWFNLAQLSTSSFIQPHFPSF